MSSGHRSALLSESVRYCIARPSMRSSPPSLPGAAAFCAAFADSVCVLDGPAGSGICAALGDVERVAERRLAVAEDESAVPPPPPPGRRKNLLGEVAVPLKERTDAVSSVLLSRRS
jgi:hypothetical protein